jgi:hypothetical protein
MIVCSSISKGGKADCGSRDCAYRMDRHRIVRIVWIVRIAMGSYVSYGSPWDCTYRMDRNGIVQITDMNIPLTVPSGPQGYSMGYL